MQNPPALQAVPSMSNRLAEAAATTHAPAHMPSADIKKEHMPALDGLRGLAALSVVIAHLPIKNVFWEKFNFGECGVFLFFVLSGFLMTHLHLQQPFDVGHVRRFCVARIARIVPLYYAVVVLAFLVSQFSQVDFHYRMGTFDFIRLLAFVGSVDVFWSVGPEFQFYGFFLMLWCIPSLPNRAKGIALWGLGAVVIGSYATSPYLPGVLFLSKLHIFLGGVGVAVLRTWLSARARPTPGSVAMLQVLACVALVELLVPYPRMLLPVFPADDVAGLSAWYYADLPRMLLAALVVLACSYRSKVSDLLLGNSLVSELGRTSFSIYLLHRPVMDVMDALGLFRRLNPWVSGIACVITVVLLSCLVNRLWETPTRHWITDKLGRPGTPPVPSRV